MSGYIQNELIECNRLRSEEAKGGNTTNNAVWTNTLSNIYDLQAGDKVSMYAGFVSEKGAGEEKTIEIKGSTLGKTKTFEYIREIPDLKITENEMDQFKPILKHVQSMEDHCRSNINEFERISKNQNIENGKKLSKNISDLKIVPNELKKIQDEWNLSSSMIQENSLMNQDSQRLKELISTKTIENVDLKDKLKSSIHEINELNHQKSAL